MQKKPKICFAASSGGHFEQILLLKPLTKEYESILVTEKTNYGLPKSEIKTYFLEQVNRRELSAPVRILKNTWISFKILKDESPDIIITTGVLAVVPLCILAKLMRKKLIFIESYAKIRSGTKTGKLLYHFADHFIVQWESMKEVYPNAYVAGSIY